MFIFPTNVKKESQNYALDCREVVVGVCEVKRLTNPPPAAVLLVDDFVDFRTLESQKLQNFRTLVVKSQW